MILQNDDFLEVLLGSMYKYTRVLSCAFHPKILFMVFQASLVQVETTLCDRIVRADYFEDDVGIQARFGGRNNEHVAFQGCIALDIGLGHVP